MDTNRRDMVRQSAIVITALFQVLGAFVLAFGGPPQVPTVLIQPANYAFAIWGVIFLLSFMYAVFQALPRNRSNSLLRQIGWFTAGAFFFNGVWEISVARIDALPAQFLFFSIAVCIGIAYIRLLLVMNKPQNNRAECWLVALPVGIFAGWMTAATLVELFGMFVIFQLLPDSLSETFLGVTFLLLGGILTAPAIMVGRGGPLQGYVAYAGAVVWALIAIIVNQYTNSLALTSAAAVSIVVVLVVLLLTLVDGWPFGKEKRIFFSNSSP